VEERRLRSSQKIPALSVCENSKISIAVEKNHEYSREAAKEFSPRRKPWVKSGI
jgi:hypothetical protein